MTDAHDSAMVDFRLPDVGEGLTEAEIVTWFVEPGDAVTVNQVIVAIETAKAVVELPCPVAGVVAAVHVDAGIVVRVGTPIVSIRPQGALANLDDADTGSDDAPSGAVLVGYGIPAPDEVDQDSGRRRRRRSAGEPLPSVPPVATPIARARAKPQVRKLARTLGVDLETIAARGPHGDITRADVLARAQESPGDVEAMAPGDRLVAVRGVQRAMADAMVRSAFSIPHAMVWRDVDVTRSEELVRSLRAAPGFTGTRVTFLSVAALGVVSMVRAYPDLQALWTDEGILHRSAINLGIAVDSPRGLLVPNIKNAHAMPPREFTQALNHLVSTAREGACTTGDLTGGSITITNIGVFDVDGGSPIINPGESAIVALGSVAQRPWVVEDRVVPRAVMTLSMSFDHRVIDGATASRALSELASFLADPAGRLIAT